MARFLDLPFSDVRNLLQALDDAGASSKWVQELMRNPRKFKQMVEDFVRASSTDRPEPVVSADTMANEPPLPGEWPGSSLASNWE